MTTYHIGTRDGLYRIEEDASDPTHVPGPSGVTVVVDGPDSVYCHDRDTVYRGLTDGPHPIDVPTDNPTHLRVDTEGIVVGGHAPLAVHTFTDGVTWTTHELPDLPPARRWTDEGATVVSEAGGRVSDTLRTDAGLAVAVERTGVFVRTGTGWERRDYGLAEDVHDLHQTPNGTWLAATGQGLYRSPTAGRTWYRLDTGQLFQGYTYFHAFASHDGTLYTSGGRHMPGGWGEDGAEALLFGIGENRNQLRAASTPTPDEYVWALTTTGEALYAGTATADVDEPGRAEGVLYERSAEGESWGTVCRLPDPVTSVVVVDD